MVIDLFSAHEVKPEPGGLAYLLSNPTARVVRGSPEITQAVIDSTVHHTRQRFTAGVMTETSSLTEETKSMLADSLLGQLLGGRPQHSLAACFVEHSDKTKTELHFVAPHLDLITRKLINPYIDRTDRHRFSAWIEKMNLQLGLDHPLDKLRRQPDMSHLRLASGDATFLLSVWEDVDRAVSSGEVTNRQSLNAFLLGKGYDVRCHTRGNRPLQQPAIVGPRGNILRLKGSTYYHPAFGTDGMPKPMDRTDANAMRRRLKELNATINHGLEFKAYWTIGRLYGRAAQQGVKKGIARKVLRKLMRPMLSRHFADQPALTLFGESRIKEIMMAKELGLELPHARRAQEGPPTTPTLEKTTHRTTAHALQNESSIGPTKGQGGGATVESNPVQQTAANTVASSIRPSTSRTTSLPAKAPQHTIDSPQAKQHCKVSEDMPFESKSVEGERQGTVDHTPYKASGDDGQGDPGDMH